MHSDNETEARVVLSLEEYLKKRQAVKKEEIHTGEWRSKELTAAMHLAELMYV